MQTKLMKFIATIFMVLPCIAHAGRVGDAAAASVANMATAIASYQVLRSMGAQPQIQRTPYGMVTTTTNNANNQQHYQQAPNYNNQNQQNQKIDFMNQ